MKEFIRQIKYWWNCKSSGLEDLIDDARDLHIKDLFKATSYTHKHRDWLLAPSYEKDQLRKENCSFQAGARVLSVYFGEDISARWLVAKAWAEGLCGYNGRAQLRNWAKVASKYGVMFKKDLPTNEGLDWEDYINLDFGLLDPIAQQHKIGSYWRVDTVDEYLECIDRGYAVAIGREWRSVYNRGGGFSAPWIITTAMKLLGFSIGGHATAGLGYSFIKSKEGVSIEKNSYSDRWGDNGFFYCELKALQKDIDLYGAFAIVPIPYTPKDKKIDGFLGQLKVLKDALLKQRPSIAQLAMDRVGTDFTNDNTVPDDVSCAFATSTICHKYDGRIPIVYGTFVWDSYLSHSPLFERVQEPVKIIKPGDIVVSPTGLGRDKDSRGHTGIYLNDKDIMSNDSQTGKWLINYTRLTWRERYYQKLGFPTRIYRYIG